MSRNQLFNVHGTEPGEPLILEEDGEWDGLTFRKELIYANPHFNKRNSKVNQHFAIDEAKMEHWATVGNQMLSNGIHVPVPLKHSDSPEATRARTLRYETGLNSRGIPALYGVVQFRDEEAAKLALTTDVSIFVPEDPVYDGLGNKYEYPIRHIALTDFPVIPNLEGFEPIAASLDIYDSKPLELGLVSGLANFARDRGTHTAITQVGGEMVGESAMTRGQHAAAAGLLGGSAALASREIIHTGKRFGKVGIHTYRKGGLSRLARAGNTFNKISRIQPVASTFASQYTKAPLKSGKIITGVGKVIRAVGRRIPMIGAASAAAGAMFAGQAISSGIAGAREHFSKARGLSLGGPGSGPQTSSHHFKKAIGFGAASALSTAAMLGAVSHRSKHGSLKSQLATIAAGIGVKAYLDTKTIKNFLRGAVARRKELKELKGLSLGGPGSGPRAANAFAGKVRDSINDSGHSELGEVAHTAFKTGIHVAENGILPTAIGLPATIAANLHAHSGSLIRRAAMTAAAGEGLNYISKTIRNDKENRRGKAYATTFGIHKIIKNAPALVAEGSLRKIGLGASILGTAIVGRALMLKTQTPTLSLSQKMQEINSFFDSHTLELGGPGVNGGPGSGPVAGVKRGPYNVDKAVGDFVGHVANKIASVGTGTIRRLATGRVARYVAKGEVVNYLASKYRGDDDSRRWQAYGAHGAWQSTVNRALAADKLGVESAKYASVLKKVEALGGAGTPKAKLVADALAHINLKRGIAVGTSAATFGLGALLVNRLLAKKQQSVANSGLTITQKAALTGAAGLGAYAVGKHLKGELSLGSIPGVKRGPYKHRVVEAIHNFQKSNFYRNALPYTQAASRTVKAVARNPLVHIAAIGEGLNQGARNLRGDDENRRGAAYTASAAGKVAVENFKAADREKHIFKAAKAATDFNFVSGAHIPISPLKERLFNFVTGKTLKSAGHLKTTRAALTAHTATVAAGLLGASLLMRGRKAKEELSLDVTDRLGFIHGGSDGRFKEKTHSELSKRSLRRKFGSLKPKKYIHEEIGKLPLRNADETPREYTLRTRKFRSEHRVENPDYYKDASEEDTTSSIASANQAVKHAALTTLGVGTTAATTAGAYVAGKDLHKVYKQETDIAGKATAKGAAAADKLNALKETVAQETSAKTVAQAVKDSRKAAQMRPTSKASTVEAMEKIADTAFAKVASLKEANIKAAAAKLKIGRATRVVEHFKKIAARPPRITFGAVKRFLTHQNVRNSLLGLAGATAAAATAAHITTEHIKATKYHAGNVGKKISNFRNKGLV